MSVERVRWYLMMLNTIGNNHSPTLLTARAPAYVAASSSDPGEALEAHLGPRGLQEATAAADAPSKLESSMPQVIRETPITIQPGETGGVGNEKVDRMVALRAFQAEATVTRALADSTQTTLAIVI